MALTSEQQAYLDALMGMVSSKEVTLIGEMMENGRDFAEVQKYANETILLERKIADGTATSEEIYEHTSLSKDFRESSKSFLQIITDSYLKYEEYLDKKLVDILHDIKRYAEMDVTATTDLYNKKEATYGEESKLFNKILKDLNDYESTMIKDPDAVYEKNGVKMKVGTSQKMVYNMLGYFEDLQKGNLKADLFEQEQLKKDPNAKVNGVFIDATGKKFTSSSPIDYTKDLSDLPLFSHDPSPSDLRQGYIGDCYLLAGLTELARRDPQAIKDSMRDNGKTVTVRFWQRVENREAEMDDFVPVYVTVDKKGLGIGAAQNCCWAQIMERAYVASGLHMTKGYTNIYNKPRPDNLEEMYQDLKKMNPEDRPTMQECPWLIDKNGNLHAPNYDYASIEGGNSGAFLSAFMGQKCENHDIDLSKYIEPAMSPSSAISGLKDALYAEYGIVPQEGEDFHREEYDYARLEHKILHGIDSEPPYHLDENNLKRAEHLPGHMYHEGSIINQLFMSCFSQANSGKLNIATLDTTVIAQINTFTTAMSMASTNEEEKANMQKLGDFFVKRVGLIKSKCLGEELTGNYTSKANKLYEKIKEWASSGYPITAGTYGESDKNNKEGIYDSHAYSVLGVEEKELGGKMMKFIKVRNPHGKVGRKYEVGEDNKITRSLDKECKDGVFLVELDDFIREYEDIHYNAPTEKPEHVAIAEQITPSCASKWNRISMTLKQAMKSTDSWFSDDSTQYQEMQKGLDSLVNATGRCVGYSYVALRDSVNEARTGAGNYIRHLCQISYPNFDTMDPKPTEPILTKLSSRQKERLKVAKSILTLTEQFHKDKSRDPKADLKDRIVQNSVETLLERNSNHPTYSKLYELYQSSPEGKKQVCEAFKELPEVKDTLGKKNYFQLAKMDAKPSEKNLEVFKTGMAKLNVEKLQQDVQKVQEAKNQEPPVAKRDDLVLHGSNPKGPVLGGFGN